MRMRIRMFGIRMRIRMRTLHSNALSHSHSNANAKRSRSHSNAFQNIRWVKWFVECVSIARLYEYNRKSQLPIDVLVKPQKSFKGPQRYHSQAIVYTVRFACFSLFSGLLSSTCWSTSDKPVVTSIMSDVIN